MSGFKLILIAAGSLTLGGLLTVAAAGAYMDEPSELVASPSIAPTTIAVQAAIKPATVKPVPPQSEGIIEGPVTYPGERIPPDLRVCATAVADRSERCAGYVKDVRFPGGFGYRLELPAGTYYVYAISPSFDPHYRAYYSAFVTCGKSFGCGDHTPLPVGVRAGVTTAGVEPGDFYR